MDHFSEFLARLAVILQIPSPLDSKSQALLVIFKDNRVAVQIEYDNKIVDNSVLLIAKVLDVDKKSIQPLYISILKGNDQGDATLSYDIEKQSIFMHMRIHPQIGEKELQQLIDHFQKTILRWREHFTLLIEKNQQELNSNLNFSFKQENLKA